MSHELIERVKRTEEKADALLASAQAKADALVEGAESGSRASREKRAKALESRKEKVFADAARDGEREAKAVLKESEAERSAFEGKWRRNSRAASEFVKSFVLKN